VAHDRYLQPIRERICRITAEEKVKSRLDHERMTLYPDYSRHPLVVAPRQ